MAYIGEAPIINVVIHELRIFLLVMLSAIPKTDKITYKKVISIVSAFISIIAIFIK